MSKFHNGPNGPAPCTATKRPCPVGGEHFESREEASEAYTLAMEGEHGVVPIMGMKKEPPRNIPRPTKATPRQNEVLAAAFNTNEELFDDVDGYASSSTARFLETKREEDPEFEGALKAKMQEAGLKGSTEQVTIFAPRWALEGRVMDADVAESGEWDRDALAALQEKHPQVDLENDEEDYGGPLDPYDVTTRAREAGLSPEAVEAVTEDYDKFYQKVGADFVDSWLKEDSENTREVEVLGEPYIMSVDAW